MRYHEIISEAVLEGQPLNPDGTNLLFHWTSAPNAAKYLRDMKVPAKWKHIIPGRGQTVGISFGYNPTS